MVIVEGFLYVVWVGVALYDCGISSGIERERDRGEGESIELNEKDTIDYCPNGVRLIR